MSISSMLIADCGATSGKWAVVDCASGSVTRFTSGPINPAVYSPEQITAELNEVREKAGRNVRRVEMYVAGAVGDSARQLAEEIQAIFALPERSVEVATDLVGACRALLDDKRGIACILGTGSNSCLWSGNAIERNMLPMGYILGDEGSGAALGAELLRRAIRRQLPPALLASWSAAYPDITYHEIVNQVYRRHAGSSYIASFVPFLAANIEHQVIAEIVDGCFERFIDAVVASYPEAINLPIVFTGGVATVFEQRLKRVLDSRGLSIGLVSRDPLELLVNRALILSGDGK